MLRECLYFYLSIRSASKGVGPKPSGTPLPLCYTSNLTRLKGRDWKFWQFKNLSTNIKWRGKYKAESCTGISLIKKIKIDNENKEGNFKAYIEWWTLKTSKKSKWEKPTQGTIIAFITDNNYLSWGSQHKFYKWYMKCFIHWTADMKSSELWSSQWWTQF